MYIKCIYSLRQYSLISVSSGRSSWPVAISVLGKEASSHQTVERGSGEHQNCGVRKQMGSVMEKECENELCVPG